MLKKLNFKQIGVNYRTPILTDLSIITKNFTRKLLSMSVTCMHKVDILVTCRYRKGPLLPCNVFKLVYPSIKVKTLPPVSVRVRTMVSVSFSFTL